MVFQINGFTDSCSIIYITYLFHYCSRDNEEILRVLVVNGNGAVGHVMIDVF